MIKKSKIDYICKCSKEYVPVIYDYVIKDDQMLVACKYQYNQQCIQILSKK